VSIGRAVADGHVQGVGDQGCGLRGIGRSADDAPGERTAGRPGPPRSVSGVSIAGTGCRGRPLTPVGVAHAGRSVTSPPTRSNHPRGGQPRRLVRAYRGRRQARSFMTGRRWVAAAVQGQEAVDVDVARHHVDVIGIGHADQLNPVIPVVPEVRTTEHGVGSAGPIALRAAIAPCSVAVVQCSSRMVGRAQQWVGPAGHVARRVHLGAPAFGGLVAQLTVLSPSSSLSRGLSRQPVAGPRRPRRSPRRWAARCPGPGGVT
jgi:hypothetical protein